MRPDSWMATYLVIRVVPRRVSTSTSTKCAAKHWRILPSVVGDGVAEATKMSLPVGIPCATICCCRSCTASTTAIPVMIVVRLPDSPTEYGQRSVSPDTTSTCDRGTPMASAAIMPNVVLAPGPTSVTPTNKVYRGRASTCTRAQLVPTPARNIVQEKPAPRLIGPASEPGLTLNCR